LLKTTHHFLSIPSDIHASLQLEYGLIWNIEGKDWNLEDIFVDMAEPDVYSTDELKAIIRDHVDITNITPMENDDEATCDVD
jgi:hypothetical protein